MEKDKCEMYRFFNRSGLPYSPILAEWRDPVRVRVRVRARARARARVRIS